MEVKQGLRRTRVLVKFRRRGNVFLRLPRDVPGWRNLNKNVELNTYSESTNKQMYKQDRQCTCNVILRSVCESLLPRETISMIYFCVCVRMRACLRVCAGGTWAWGCAYVHVVLLIQQATGMRHIVTSYVAPLAPPYFFDIIS